MGVKTFLLMAGGTGGHIFPALAVAVALRERGHKVVWLGSEGAMETRIVPQHGIEIETLAIKGVRGNGLKRKLMLPFTLWHTIRAARCIIRKHQVDGAVGFGGFVTVPGGVAAKLCGVPLVIHEQNAVVGLSNRILAKLASRVLYAFPKAFGDENGLVGNPVRADIAALPAPEERFAERSGSLKLLVTGGSLGADILNRLLPEALALLPAEQRPQVRHQSGRGKLEVCASVMPKPVCRPNAANLSTIWLRLMARRIWWCAAPVRLPLPSWRRSAWARCSCLTPMRWTTTKPPTPVSWPPARPGCFCRRAS